MRLPEDIRYHLDRVLTHLADLPAERRWQAIADTRRAIEDGLGHSAHGVVVELLASESNAAVARRLGVSPGTVTKYGNDRSAPDGGAPITVSLTPVHTAPGPDGLTVETEGLAPGDGLHVLVRDVPHAAVVAYRYRSSDGVHRARVALASADPDAPVRWANVSLKAQSWHRVRSSTWGPDSVRDHVLVERGVPLCGGPLTVDAGAYPESVLAPRPADETPPPPLCTGCVEAYARQLASSGL